MRKLKKYGYEFLALLWTAVFFDIILYWVVEDSATQSIRVGLFALFVVDGAALYFTLRALWRTKWKKSLVSSAQKIIAKLAQHLLSFFEKRNRKKEKKTAVLSGKTTVSFDFPGAVSPEKKARKTPKWKHLQTDRERLGYLYQRMIEQKIKHGLPVYSSETPDEIKNKTDHEAVENKIFDVYIGNRYQETVETDGKALNDLRIELYKHT